MYLPALFLSAIVKIGGYFVGNKKVGGNKSEKVQYNLFCGLPHPSLAFFSSIVWLNLVIMILRSIKGFAIYA